MQPVCHWSLRFGHFLFLALRAWIRCQLLALWGANSGVSGLTFWEHVLELDKGKLVGDISARAHGVWRMVVDAPYEAAAENRGFAVGDRRG